MIGTAENKSHSTRYTGIAGVNDNDIVIETDVIERHQAFILMTTAGAADVDVTLDGTNWSTAPLSLVDMGGISASPVIVTVANRVYGFRGVFYKIRVRQNGAPAVANAVLLAGHV